MPSALPRLFLARHGDTAWTDSRQRTGRTDIPLNAVGEDRARQFGVRLRRFSFASVFTSPLQRASRTCELAGFGAVAKVDPDLVEWDYGHYEGLVLGEIQRERPTWELFRDGRQADPAQFPRKCLRPSIGRSYPLGVTVIEGGVNFSLFSRTATGVELLLFDREDDANPSRVIRIDPVTNRTYHYWHVFVPGVRPGQIYGYRVEGPSAPERGLRFDSAKVLLDPYGRGVVVPKNYDREAAKRAGDNAATAMKSVVVDPGAYDWEGDLPLSRPSSRTIIYEMHVRGFTRHPNSGVARRSRGTYAGLIEKIPYLRGARHHRRGVLPVFAFDATGLPAGRGELLGLSAGVLLCAAPGLQLAQRLLSARSMSFETW